jgi:serine protease
MKPTTRQAPPASCDGVVTVGATRITGGITYYSTTAPAWTCPVRAVAATSTATGRLHLADRLQRRHHAGIGYAQLHGLGGTSMASPHVAAVAALVQSALIAKGKDPLTPAAMRTLLKETARPFPVAIRRHPDRHRHRRCRRAGQGTGRTVHRELRAGGHAADQQGRSRRPERCCRQQQLYSFEAVAGKQLSVITYGGTGNVSVYIAQAVSRAPATTTQVDPSRHVRNGAGDKPVAGTYYIKVVGEAAYNGVSILATQYLVS